MRYLKFLLSIESDWPRRSLPFVPGRLRRRGLPPTAEVRPIELLRLGLLGDAFVASSVRAYGHGPAGLLGLAENPGASRRSIGLTSAVWRHRAPGGASGQEMAVRACAEQDRRVIAPTYDLEHVRRGRRLLAILVDRFGVSHFLERAGGCANLRACDDAVALASTWIERRTGRVVSARVAELLRRDLRSMLRRRVAEGAACVKR